MKHIHVIQKVWWTFKEDIKVIKKAKNPKIIKNDPFSRYTPKTPKNPQKGQKGPPITKGTPPRYTIFVPIFRLR